MLTVLAICCKLLRTRWSELSVPLCSTIKIRYPAFTFTQVAEKMEAKVQSIRISHNKIPMTEILQAIHPQNLPISS